mmetsp:Transcript_8789/g.18772  ORF Transcript_8789/g.18772 Transcript_8789/m.18772 type:complete len:82 (-) Transcript_8789:208-453(-)
MRERRGKVLAAVTADAVGTLVLLGIIDLFPDDPASNASAVLLDLGYLDEAVGSEDDRVVVFGVGFGELAVGGLTGGAANGR